MDIKEKRKIKRIKRLVLDYPFSSVSVIPTILLEKELAFRKNEIKRVFKRI